MAMRTMTVGELIALLEDAAEEHGKDMPVIFSSDYGDYSHTEQAHEIKGEAEVVTLDKSAYSHSGFAVATEEDFEDESGAEYADEDEKYEAQHGKPYKPFLRIK